MSLNSIDFNHETQNTTAILLAGGKSSRMGSTNKIFIKLGNIPVLLHSLYTLNSSQEINSIIVVVPKEKLHSSKKLISIEKFQKVKMICAGGDSRQSSVDAALSHVPSCKWVLIHDAARPFISKNMISNGISAAKDTGAATAAIPITDTLKLSEDNGLSVKHTISKENIWAAQTPQIFSLDILKRGYENPLEEFSDDASLIESLGLKVKIFFGCKKNIKITFPSDLSIASAILDSSNNKQHRD